ncbi:MAG: arginase family protein [Chitinophagaceae bacterium]
MKEIVLIEAPTNLGLREPAPGIEPGVKFLPAALDKEGFGQSIGVKERVRVEPPPYSMQLDEASKVRNADAIAGYSKELAIAIKGVIEKNKIPLVIGGDCSVMIGAGVALKQKGSFGLFHLDGHTDYMGPEHSETGGAAGMGLAIVAGRGHDKLINIEGLKPYIAEGNIFCVGNREYDPGYVQLSLDSNMYYFDLESIHKNGAAAIAGKFLQHVDEKRLDGFWIHFDVDVLNDDVMPCVDSRTIDGLWYDELKDMLKPLLASSYFTGMEITILDPTLDNEGKYIKQLVHEMVELFKP